MSITGFTLSAATAVTVLLTVACGAEGQAAPVATADSENQATSIPAPTSTPEPPTVLPATSTPAPPAATVTTEGCYDRGYAGRIRDPNDKNIDIYLLVEPPDDPADDARAIAETLCVLGGRFTPNLPVRTMKVNYTLKQLKDWRALLSQIRKPDGIYTSGVHIQENRIGFQILTELGKSRLEDQVMAVGIPLEAVNIEVREQIGLDTPPAKVTSDYGVELSIEYAPELISGEPVQFSVVVRNTTDLTLEFEHGEPPEADIVVLTSDGRQVWRFLWPIQRGVGKSSDISPGQSIRFPIPWSQVDDDGFRVPVGRYLVRGFIRFPYSEERVVGNFVVTENLSTAPEEILIVGQ